MNAIRRIRGLKEGNHVIISFAAEMGSTEFNDQFFKSLSNSTEEQVA